MKINEQTFDFSYALQAMRDGYRVTRKLWHDKGMDVMYVRLHRAPKHTDVLPYITIRTASGKIVPWVPSHVDLLAVDYQLIEREDGEDA